MVSSWGISFCYQIRSKPKKRNEQWKTAVRNEEEWGMRKRWGIVEKMEGSYSFKMANTQSLFAKLLLKDHKRQILVVASISKHEIINILLLIRRNVYGQHQTWNRDK